MWSEQSPWEKPRFLCKHCFLQRNSTKYLENLIVLFWHQERAGVFKFLFTSLWRMMKLLGPGSKKDLQSPSAFLSFSNRKCQKKWFLSYIGMKTLVQNNKLPWPIFVLWFSLFGRYLPSKLWESKGFPPLFRLEELSKAVPNSMKRASPFDSAQIAKQRRVHSVPEDMTWQWDPEMYLRDSLKPNQTSKLWAGNSPSLLGETLVLSVWGHMKLHKGNWWWNGILHPTSFILWEWEKKGRIKPKHFYFDMLQACEIFFFFCVSTCNMGQFAWIHFNQTDCTGKNRDGHLVYLHWEAPTEANDSNNMKHGHLNLVSNYIMVGVCAYQARGLRVIGGSLAGRSGDLALMLFW